MTRWVYFLFGLSGNGYTDDGDDEKVNRMINVWMYPEKSLHIYFTYIDISATTRAWFKIVGDPGLSPEVCAKNVWFSFF